MDGSSPSPTASPTKAPVVVLVPTAPPSQSPTATPTRAPALGSIPGTVTDEEGNPLPGAVIEIVDENGDPVELVTTGPGGTYDLTVPPGDYCLKETNPAGYTNDISDQDSTPDGDAGDPDTAVDNKICLTRMVRMIPVMTSWMEAAYRQPHHPPRLLL